ncbi:MAG: putative zinc-binding metallopeptidase [Alistipes sp.]|nr:hypothetical protein [Rikenellaceae bacterium]MBO5350859.1 putative zinc-binding metallopeptidase [Alistipes sp.]MBQ2843324.1 putative zinc-binding metallopeptidase [Alistipes sp.]MBQ8651977.1 putative zinc-binding metallopeptidase [Alistipes sp.]MBR3773822.1 putative zinc-binding metallopeptidase [Alistipes sp.]
MKRLFKYTLLAAFSLLAVACSEDDLSDQSVITNSVNEPTEFDAWLEQNYRAPFNIRFLYRYEDIETDMSYDLVPAREIYSRIMAKMVRFLWLDPYTEVTNAHFMRNHSPRLMQIIGSGAYNQNNTLLLGTAEGGQKITLYVGNWLERFMTIHYNNGVDEKEGYWVEILDPDQVNYYYMHTIHHEFAHILHQKKMYPLDFNTISQGDYVAQWTSISEEEAAQKGFVSRYGSSAQAEDFVEVFSYYLTWSPEVWDAKVAQGGEIGGARIERKIAIVKSYMKDTWGIDMDELRAVLARRYAEIDRLNWSDFKTE